MGFKRRQYGEKSTTGHLFNARAAQTKTDSYSNAANALEACQWDTAAKLVMENDLEVDALLTLVQYRTNCKSTDGIATRLAEAVARRQAERSRDRAPFKEKDLRIEDDGDILFAK